MGQLALEAPLLGLGNAGGLLVWVQVRVPEAAMTFKIASPAPFERPAEIAGPNSVRIEGRRERDRRQRGRRSAGWLCIRRKKSERNRREQQHDDDNTHDTPPVLAAHAGFVPAVWYQVDIRENRVLE
jgi:hypothetical protein